MQPTSNEKDESETLYDFVKKLNEEKKNGTETDSISGQSNYFLGSLPKSLWNSAL